MQDLLKKNLALYKTKPAHGQGSEGVAVLQASEDLLLLLLPHLSAADSNALFAMCLSAEMLGHWDGGVQKRCYRWLARLVETGSATIAAEVVLKKLLDESQSVAPAAKRVCRLVRCSVYALIICAGPVYIVRRAPSRPP